ncbi:Uncharacterized protein APZ42_000042 [Daphnia magna]|uniref:Uncharacterized protein n=1 Tax=Daphnia magna TaxID=35525 RepID=A0A164JYN7_9CRUS|nr:Uncharacterized protein APZ42_000042 [Daphnia magna]
MMFSTRNSSTIKFSVLLDSLDYCDVKIVCLSLAHRVFLDCSKTPRFSCTTIAPKKFFLNFI